MCLHKPIDVAETLKSVPVKGTPAKNQNHKQGKTNNFTLGGGVGVGIAQGYSTCLEFTRPWTPFQHNNKTFTLKEFTEIPYNTKSRKIKCWNCNPNWKST